MPYYNFNDFIDNCKNNSTNVFVVEDALMDARTDFNLNTKSELLDFIASGGLEELKFINTSEWRNNPDKSNPINVDAYEFKTLRRLGYIAFMYNNKIKKWNIKSFKLSTNSNHNVMVDAFKKAGLYLIKEN